MLMRKNREEMFARRRAAFDANKRKDWSAIVLDADDLLLGYRLDIWTQSQKKWLSLHQREAEYFLVENSAKLPITEEHFKEEGHFKPFASAGDEDGHFTDEIVARWTNWSLSVPLPRFDAKQPIGWPPFDRRVPADFRWRFSAVSGSLPKLRFGTAYRVRLRIADLAGGGLTSDDTSPNARCELGMPGRYRRFEPVLPPRVSVYSARPLGPMFAEDAYHIVLRSDLGVDADAFQQRIQIYSDRHRRARAAAGRRAGGALQTRCDRARRREHDVLR
jgi:hypothetical protein